jgi:hypothetical protein
MLMDKIPYDQLTDMLAAARAKVTPGTKWQHYKGGEYIAQDAVLVEVNNQVCVLYHAVQYPEVSFVRPVASWLEDVTWNDRVLPRFTKLG